MQEAVATREAVARRFRLDDASELFHRALTHPSYAHERQDGADNQRLEFLGDAVLGFCASEILYERFPSADEGTLTRTRAQLVNADALAAFARTHQVPAVLKLGRGASASGLTESTNVLADAVEALIAACYLERGLEVAREVCAAVVEHGLASVPSAGVRDAKSQLQERVQALGQPPPTYRVVASGGPAHARWFEVEAVLLGQRIGFGRGSSKRGAERCAAEAALDAAEFENLAGPEAKED